MPPSPSALEPVGSRRTHGLALAVVALGLAVTAPLTLTAWAARDRNEDRLLEQRAREVGAVLESALPRVQTPLASAAELAEATDGDPASFGQLMGPFLVPQGPFVSASLWRLGQGGAPEPLTTAGAPSALASEPEAVIDEFLTRSADTPALAVLDLLDRPDPRLGYSFTSPRLPASFVAHAESALPPDRLSVPQQDSAFADLDYALYLGDSVASDALLIASTHDVPLEGRTASETVEFGDAALHLVITPGGNLGGWLMAVLPWLIAGTGVAVTLGAALFTERLLRSRDHAQRLAAELGRVAEENASLYAEQRTVAQTLQESLLPHELPMLAGVDIAVRYESGVGSLDVGGDWYDVIEAGPGRALAVVGDVSGRGLPAATIMAALRHAIRAYAVQGDDPAEILAKLAHLLSVARDGHFATVLCAALDVGRREVRLASAGHPRPLIVNGVGADFVATEVGVPVGTMPEPSYRTSTVTVPPRGTLLLFTDGLFERRGETVDVGLERLRRLAVNGGLPLDALLSRVLDGLATGSSSDDTAILGLRWQS